MSDDSPPLSARGPGRPAGGRAGETREALIEAAHEVMAERGYPRVTLREVADLFKARQTVHVNDLTSMKY